MPGRNRAPVLGHRIAPSRPTRRAGLALAGLVAGLAALVFGALGLF